MAKNNDELNFDYSDALDGDNTEDLLAGGADVDDLIGAGVLEDRWETPQEKAEREEAQQIDNDRLEASFAEARRFGSSVSF